MAESGAVRTIPEIVDRHGATRGERLAYRFEGRETTYAQFQRNTNRVANGLMAAGLSPGSRLAYYGKNSDHYFELLIGAMKAGVVMTPINWRLAPPEVAYIIKDAEAPALFFGAEFAATVRQVLPRLPLLHLVVIMEGQDQGWTDYETWRDAQADTAPASAIDADAVAMQLYTSGTTGNPKGTMLTHRNFVDLRDEGKYGPTPDWNQWSEDDAALVAMPVFHIGGSGWGLFALFYGALSVVAREFDPTAVLDYFERDRISKLFLVPAAMQFIVRHPRARQVDYSRLKYIMYGASPIPADLLRECIEVFKCGFVQVYGMTETTGTITVLSPEDHTLDGAPRMRSAGKALPGVEVAIVDAEGRRLPAGQVGEIATRSQANMAGYWHLPEAAARTMSPDNWLRTGDAGYMDADGYVYIQDRIKDMIISGGENIYPAEVENAVFGHPAVAEVAVIGVPDETWGESVKAIVVLKKDAEASPADIIAWTRQRIAAFKTPKSVEFVAALPRNATGKILRRQLREPYWQGRERGVN
ncbi:MAG: fatty acid--CoA ligase [Xanthobacteraceae bacterium]|nr:fatty acid--CoA ligase [Xanthobacteraceae bacterium]